MKKLLSIVFCVSLCLCLAACGGKDPTIDTSLDQQSQPLKTEPEQPKVVYSQNPLTGLSDITPGSENLRPVAIMINNIKIAQTVQTGVQKADLIYETEVEGGITRLMAVFKDISKVSQIGTVRSARYAYIDLALGHDAIYVHCGIDPIYAEPYSYSSGVNNFNINSNPWAAYGFREKNGLSYEHTVYTTSEKLKEGFKNLEFRTTTEKSNTFCQFHPNNEVKIPGEGEALGVTVKFSSAATSVFTYNKETKLYTKNSSNVTNKDYKTGEEYQITNVFVLHTNISNYSDGYHRKVDLNGGTGYYISNGGYKKIIWKKAGPNQPIQYFNVDNTPLSINAGKSWICITGNGDAPVFEGSQNNETSQAVSG